MPDDSKMEARMDRGNQMFDALHKETDRGKACVGDAMLDELFKELVAARFIDDKKLVREMTGEGQPLGSHGARLKVAHLLGWIGPQTYHDCRTIHRVRNKMAHSLDVADFTHVQIRDLIDNLEAPKHVHISENDVSKRLNLKRHQDKFLFAVISVVLQMWRFIEESERPSQAIDTFPVPQPKA